jgi:thymidylate synthase (FAD)
MTEKPVKLVSVTPDAERQILYCARVSSNQANDDPGLLRYLIRNGHWSPFEMASMTLEIRTSRAIAQQILRHRSFSFQEFSQRYAAATNVIFHEVRVKGSTNRQGSVPNKDKAIEAWWVDAQKEVFALATMRYQDALDIGIAPEVARFLLPLATETKLYMAGTIRSWIHYIQMRTDDHAQLEHQELALLARAIFVQEFPTTSEALAWKEPDA